MFTTKFLGRNGSQVERLEAQVASQEVERALLARELGTYDPQEIIARVRALESKVSETTHASAEGTGTSAQGDEGELSQPTSALELMEKVRSFNNRIKDLNSTVAGMEAQLVSLYEEKEGMERQIGAGDLEGILQIIQGYKATISHMEQQLMAMYSAREILQSEMGTSDPHRIATLFRSVYSLVGQIQEQMKTVDLSSVSSAPEPRPVSYVDADLPRVTPAAYDGVFEQKPAGTAPSSEKIAVSAMPAVTSPAPAAAPVTATPLAAAAPPAATAPVTTAPTPVIRPTPSPLPATPVVLPAPATTAVPATGADAPRSVSPAVAAAAAAFATAAVVSAASVAGITASPASSATGKGKLAPDDPDYDPLSNPDDPINDDSLINGTP